MESLIIKYSVFGFEQTYKRLKKQLEDYPGVTIVLEWDHKELATKNKLTLYPTKSILISHPFLETPLIQNTQSIALDMPLKILVAQELGGDVKLVYNNPLYLQEKHQLRGGDTVIETWAKLLNKITEEAVH